MRTLSFVLVLAAAACADLSGMRANDPVRAGRFAGHWRAVAECINLRLDGRVLYDAPNETALVGDVPQNNMLGNKFAYYEMVIVQAAAGSVFIELRQEKALDHLVNTETYWTAVEACAGSR